MRAAWPLMSGSDANSTKLTVITPSVAAIGAGNGSLAVCADTSDVMRTSNTTALETT
jgi:hypothetical protein